MSYYVIQLRVLDEIHSTERKENNLTLKFLYNVVIPIII